MGCYLIPTVLAIIVFFIRKKGLILNTKHNIWLNQLLLGGTVFGFVDHLWNGELFMFGPNLLSDLVLGAVITAVIFGIWQVMVWADRTKAEKTHKRTT